MKYLRPIRLKQSYYSRLEKIINEIFYEVCFAPVLDAFKSYRLPLENAPNILSRALKSGKIIFQDGKFYGDYSASITKEFRELGAKFDKSDKSWSLSNLPVHIQTAIADAENRYAKIKQQILDNLSLSYENLSNDKARERLISQYDVIIKEMNQDFVNSVKAISIPPKLTPEMRTNIATEWGNNLDYYIKNWAEQNILKLREMVATNTYNGRRAEGLVKNIQDDFGVSRRKAKFLARQETSLLMTQIRQERYKDAGITKYKWSTSSDERVRPDHKLLEGTIQTWDNPPIVNRQNGSRAHPGQDFNCRCVAIPVIR